MNPLIEKTAKQAGAWFPTGYPSGEGGDEYWSDSIIFSKPDLEKFAKLLVEQCVQVVEGGSFLHDQAPTAQFARECSAAIRRHFGISL